MHIEVRMQGRRKKYYLAHSLRTGKKVKKQRFYLGSDLSHKELALKRKYAEKAIKERIEAQKAIRDPFRIALSMHEMEELKALEAKGEMNVIHLSEEDWKQFTVMFTYNTNAIEGSTVNESEVRGILERNTIPPKPKYEISETYGVAEAINYSTCHNKLDNSVGNNFIQ